MTIEMSMEYRPCRVTTRKKTPHGTKVDVYEGLFHRWTSEQWTYSPVMRGQVGGQMQSTYGIVELKTGEVRLFSPDQIQFLDSKADEYTFPESDQSIRQAVNVLRDELLKHGDLYDGFHASIKSALNDYGYETCCVEDANNEVAYEILKRIIGD